MPLLIFIQKGHLPRSFINACTATLERILILLF